MESEITRKSSMTKRERERDHIAMKALKKKRYFWSNGAENISNSTETYE